MADERANAAAAADRLRRLGRLLRDLKVTEEYLRQYPGLAAKVAALMEETRPPTGRG